MPETLESFGEADLYTGWAAHLKACGSDEALVIQQVADVVCVFELWSKRRQASDSAISRLSALLDRAAVDSVGVSSEEPTYEMSDVAAMPVGTFIVSIRRKGAFRRLHCFGSCSLVPGVDYQRWEDLGLVEPAVHSYSARCKNCFGEVRASSGVVHQVRIRHPVEFTGSCINLI